MVYALIVLSIICSDLFTKKLISDKLYIEEKKEIIHIIELYNQNKIQEVLFRLIKLMSIGKDILDWFDIT